MNDKEWVAQLKTGDAVEVWDRHHKIYSSVVKRRTPTGRIVLDGDTVFRPDGWVLKAAGSCYSDRHLRKP